MEIPLLGADFANVKLLIECLEELEDKNLERFKISGFQKHGENKAELPLGHTYTHEVLWELGELIKMAIENKVISNLLTPKQCGSD